MSTTNKKLPSGSSPVATRPLRFRLDSPVIDTPTEAARVELVPMIDVVFCILIFFILAAVGYSRQQAITIDLPKASSGTPQEQKLLIVSLNEFGQVFVEQQPVVAKAEFLQKLQDYLQNNPNGLMALYASPKASYNDVVQVLDLLRQVGGDRVALATLPDPNSPQPGATPGLAPSVPPGTTGVPGLTPYPNPYDPYGTQIPGNPYNPAQPQAPLNPGLPQLTPSPGINPGMPPLPGQMPINPNNPAVPTPGATVPPNLNPNPGNLGQPTPGITPSPRTNPTPGTPGNSTRPAPNTTTPPRT
ncbi:MAG TPA: biopolymer transporter ExbD [Coleofasciculaceae cyanobacterium]